MSTAFRVCALSGRPADPSPRADLRAYLGRVHDRFARAEHAQTRAYTCASAPPAAALDLQWNDGPPAGERLLGAFGGVVGEALVVVIEAEFVRGAAVRLCVFNSDADLCAEELLVPAASPRGA